VNRADRLSRVASPKVVLPVAWLTTLALHRRRGAVRIGVATTIAVVTTKILKRIVARPRPRLFCRTRRRSFPSGHSAASSAYLLSVATMAPYDMRPATIGAAVLGSAVVNRLRVAAREHWTTDVLAGDVLGMLAVAAAHQWGHRRRSVSAAPHATIR
jgi:membrane-associated phospholipid phosphatase